MKDRCLDSESEKDVLCLDSRDGLPRIEDRRDAIICEDVRRNLDKDVVGGKKAEYTSYGEIRESNDQGFDATHQVFQDPLR